MVIGRQGIGGRLGSAARRLLRDDTGSLLPIAAVGVVVLAAMVGGGVDISRAYKAKTRLQAACDAGVLAGRRAVAGHGFDTAASGEASAFFDNNFNALQQDAQDASFVPSSSDNGNTVVATASAGIPTAVMGVFGYRMMPVSVSCSASLGLGNSDVTMVLDTTGSMKDALVSGGPSKLAMLQAAMKNFYDTVAAATSGGNARVRYAFVPYSSSVNVGHLIRGLDPAYLVDNRTIQSREAVMKKKAVNTFSHWGPPTTTYGNGSSTESILSTSDYTATKYTKRNDCTNALPANTNWANYGSSATETDVEVNAQGKQVTTITKTQPQRRNAYTCVERSSGSGKNKVTWYSRILQVSGRDVYNYTYETRDPVYTTTYVDTNEFSHWVYKAINYNTSAYKLGTAVTTKTGTNGGNVSSTWAGCIEERQTTAAATFAFDSVNGITPATAKDLKIDVAPDVSDNTTKWAPMWPEVAYYRTSWVNIGYGYGYYDYTDKAESQTGGKANSYCPYRAQLLKTMTEEQFDDYADQLHPEGSTYHDFGMLWGARISSPQGMFADTVNIAPANGSTVARHLIFMTDGQMAPSIAVQGSYGIEWHDRRVTTDGSSGHTARHDSRFLAICEAVKAKGIRLWVIAFATDLNDNLEACASDSSSFTANNAAGLNDAFRSIATEVGELRITQ